MMVKYGTKTTARALVMVSPLDDATSAALLSVACWHDTGPQDRGR